MLSAPGIGSGLDVNGIVQQLVEADSTKLKKLQQKEKAYQVQLSEYSSIKNMTDKFYDSITKLSKTQGFYSYSAITSNQNVVNVSITNSTYPDQHEIVVTQLACAYKASSAGFENADSPLSTNGRILITSQGADFTVQIDETNNSLNGICAAINSSADNKTVIASVINVNNNENNPEYRLLLTSQQTGSNSTISLVDLDDAGIANTLDFSHVITSAKNATLTFDGFPVVSSSNTINSIQPGLTLSVTGTGSSILSINKDTSQTSQAVESFVNTYNDFLKTINNAYKNTLHGDSAVGRIKSSVRSTLNYQSNNDGDISSLADIGISSNPTTGELNINKDKLTSIIENNLDSLVSLFTYPKTGLATQLANTLESIDEKGGILDIKTKSINQYINDIGERIKREKVHLEKIEQNYKDEFTNLDVIISNLNSTSDYLTQQLDNLPSQNRSKK